MNVDRNAVKIIFMLAVILLVFVLTAVPYFLISMSSGMIDFMYFLLLWGLLILSTRFVPPAGYASSFLIGILMTFPISLFVYVSFNGRFWEAGNLRLRIGEGFFDAIAAPYFLVWLLGYIFMACSVQFLVRELRHKR